MSGIEIAAASAATAALALSALSTKATPKIGDIPMPPLNAPAPAPAPAPPPPTSEAIEAVPLPQPTPEPEVALTVEEDTAERDLFISLVDTGLEGKVKNAEMTKAIQMAKKNPKLLVTSLAGGETFLVHLVRIAVEKAASNNVGEPTWSETSAYANQLKQSAVDARVNRLRGKRGGASASQLQQLVKMTLDTSSRELAADPDNIAVAKQVSESFALLVKNRDYYDENARIKRDLAGAFGEYLKFITNAQSRSQVFGRSIRNDLADVMFDDAKPPFNDLMIKSAGILWTSTNRWGKFLKEAGTTNDSTVVHDLGQAKGYIQQAATVKLKIEKVRASEANALRDLKLKQQDWQELVSKSPSDNYVKDASEALDRAVDIETKYAQAKEDLLAVENELSGRAQSWKAALEQAVKLKDKTFVTDTLKREKDEVDSVVKKAAAAYDIYTKFYQQRKFIAQETTSKETIATNSKANAESTLTLLDEVARGLRQGMALRGAIDKVRAKSQLSDPNLFKGFVEKAIQAIQSNQVATQTVRSTLFTGRRTMAARAAMAGGAHMDEVIEFLRLLLPKQEASVKSEMFKTLVTTPGNVANLMPMFREFIRSATGYISSSASKAALFKEALKAPLEINPTFAAAEPTLGTVQKEKEAAVVVEQQSTAATAANEVAAAQQAKADEAAIAAAKSSAERAEKAAKAIEMIMAQRMGLKLLNESSSNLVEAQQRISEEQEQAVASGNSAAIADANKKASDIQKAMVKIDVEKKKVVPPALKKVQFSIDRWRATTERANEVLKNTSEVGDENSKTIVDLTVNLANKRAEGDAIAERLNARLAETSQSGGGEESELDAISKSTAADVAKLRAEITQLQMPKPGMFGTVAAKPAEAKKKAAAARKRADAATKSVAAALIKLDGLNIKGDARDFSRLRHDLEFHRDATEAARNNLKDDDETTAAALNSEVGDLEVAVASVKGVVSDVSAGPVVQERNAAAAVRAADALIKSANDLVADLKQKVATQAHLDSWVASAGAIEQLEKGINEAVVKVGEDRDKVSGLLEAAKAEKLTTAAPSRTVITSATGTVDTTAAAASTRRELGEATGRLQGSNFIKLKSLVDQITKLRNANVTEARKLLARDTAISVGVGVNRVLGFLGKSVGCLGSKIAYEFGKADPNHCATDLYNASGRTLFKNQLVAEEKDEFDVYPKEVGEPPATQDDVARFVTAIKKGDVGDLEALSLLKAHPDLASMFTADSMPLLYFVVEESIETVLPSKERKAAQNRAKLAAPAPGGGAMDGGGILDSAKTWAFRGAMATTAAAKLTLLSEQIGPVLGTLTGQIPNVLTAVRTGTNAVAAVIPGVVGATGVAAVAVAPLALELTALAALYEAARPVPTPPFLNVIKRLLELSSHDVRLKASERLIKVKVSTGWQKELKPLVELFVADKKVRTKGKPDQIQTRFIAALAEDKMHGATALFKQSTSELESTSFDDGTLLVHIVKDIINRVKTKKIAPSRGWVNPFKRVDSLDKLRAEDEAAAAAAAAAPAPPAAVEDEEEKRAVANAEKANASDALASAEKALDDAQREKPVDIVKLRELLRAKKEAEKKVVEADAAMSGGRLFGTTYGFEELLHEVIPYSTWQSVRDAFNLLVREGDEQLKPYVEEFLSFQVGLRVAYTTEQQKAVLHMFDEVDKDGVYAEGPFKDILAAQRKIPKLKGAFPKDAAIVAAAEAAAAEEAARAAAASAEARAAWRAETARTIRTGLGEAVNNAALALAPIRRRFNPPSAEGSTHMSITEAVAAREAAAAAAPAAATTATMTAEERAAAAEKLADDSVAAKDELHRAETAKSSDLNYMRILLAAANRLKESADKMNDETNPAVVEARTVIADLMRERSDVLSRWTAEKAAAEERAREPAPEPAPEPAAAEPEADAVVPVDEAAPIDSSRPPSRPASATPREPASPIPGAAPSEEENDMSTLDEKIDELKAKLADNKITVESGTEQNIATTFWERFNASRTTFNSRMNKWNPNYAIIDWNKFRPRRDEATIRQLARGANIVGWDTLSPKKLLITLRGMKKETAGAEDVYAAELIQLEKDIFDAEQFVLEHLKSVRSEEMSIHLTFLLRAQQALTAEVPPPAAPRAGGRRRTPRRRRNGRSRTSTFRRHRKH